MFFHLYILKIPADRLNIYLHYYIFPLIQPVLLSFRSMMLEIYKHLRIIPADSSINVKMKWYFRTIQSIMDLNSLQ